ncbi:MAG: restriction endonuclease subunit R [Bacteroidetes bacterium]|nr:restriction endonuclease subunit R [Bacteroidota bacterium]
MDALNLPAYAFRTRERDGKRDIFDPIRQKYVRLTSEEWVRQHFVQYLIQEHHVPRGLIAVEHGFKDRDMPRRADIVAFDRQGQPLLIAECKAPAVSVTQETFDQVARYNRVLRVPYLVVTNGHAHYACRIDFDEGAYAFLDDLPGYDDLRQARV